jgi:ethanolamine utilization microcompartment shell protein EutS
MQTLIAKYLANPNEKTASKLRAYIASHPMAICLATPEQMAVIATILCAPSHA